MPTIYPVESTLLSLPEGQSQAGRLDRALGHYSHTRLWHIGFSEKTSSEELSLQADAETVSRNDMGGYHGKYHDGRRNRRTRIHILGFLTCSKDDRRFR